VLLVGASAAAVSWGDEQVRTVETVETIDRRTAAQRAYRRGRGVAVEPMDGAVIRIARGTRRRDARWDRRTRTGRLDRYAVDRVQYGRPIGSFQAVKHRAPTWPSGRGGLGADRTGCGRARRGRPEAALDVTAASVVATSAALANARDNIQNHGAIGFTAEHSAHRYLSGPTSSAPVRAPSQRVERLRAGADPW